MRHSSYQTPPPHCFLNQVHWHYSAWGVVRKYHRLGGWSNRHFYFLTSGSWRSRCHQAWVLMRSLFLACRELFFHKFWTWLFSVHAKREHWCLSPSNRRIPVWLHEGATLMTSFNLIYLPQAISPNAVTWWERGGGWVYSFNIWMLWGHSLVHYNIS